MRQTGRALKISQDNLFNLRKAICQLEEIAARADEDAYAEVVRRCGNLGALVEGKHVHSLIEQSPHWNNRFLRNFLVEMYGKCGRLAEASAIFSGTKERNVYSWNMMMSALARNGQFSDALQIYGQMEAAGVKQNEISYTTILSVCSSSKALTEGRKIHSSIVADAWDSKTTICNSLIHMYSKCGDMDAAKDIFSKIQSKNVVSWTSLILGYAQNGRNKEALELYARMSPEGVMPNEVTFISVLGACSKLRALEYGKSIHVSIIAARFDSHLIVCNSLMNMYSKCRSLDDARKVFDAMEKRRDLVSWNVMLSAYSQLGYGKETLDLYRRMAMEEVQPNNITYACILDACGMTGDLGQGMILHNRAVSAGFGSDEFTMTTVITMYSRCGRLSVAREVFNGVEQKSVQCWNAMIAAYAQHGNISEALQIFHRMSDGVDPEPNDVTFMSILGACAEARALEEGQEIHRGNISKSRRYGCEVVVGNALINMYEKCGVIDRASEVFREMKTKDLVSWTTMITACAHHSHCDEAAELYRKMLSEGYSPDDIAFVAILEACAEAATMKLLSQGEGVHSQVVEKGMAVHVAVGTALVHMYGKHGKMAKAKSAFEEIECRNLCAWTAMVTAYARNGEIDKAMEVVMEMNSEGVELDRVVFMSILSGCSHRGVVKKGREVFVGMCDYGVEANVDSYGCMVDLLARSGWLKEAEELIESMPWYPSVVMWMSLLWACRVQGGDAAELAARATEEVSQLQPCTSSQYRLLLGMYAAMLGQ